jgi:uncharacterized protein (DUF1330 family)
MYFLVRSKVEDSTKWKSVFDEMSTTRKAAGSKGGYVFRNINNSNEIVILLEFEDLGKVRQFAESEDLKQAMQRSGVVDKPDIYFLEETDRPAE